MEPDETHERHWTPRVSSATLARLTARAAVAEPCDTAAVESPFTGEALGEVRLGTAADVEQAAAAARAAQAAWARRPISERAAVMLRFHDLLIERAHEALDVVQLETGKARRDALEEVLDTAIQARYYAHTAADYLRPRRRKGTLPIATRAWELHHPRGVVGIIVPWNYPLILTAGDAIPALLAGNGVLVKPDVQTPFSGLWAAALLEEAGLPPGLLQVVTGRGAPLGVPIIEAVDYLLFTGSTAAGRMVATEAAERLVPCGLELGGKNPLLVLPDADLAKAVHGTARAICANSGQLCIAVERIYVHTDVYDAFVPALADALSQVRMGVGFDFAPDMGSLKSAKHLAAVAAHVEEAVAKGAEVLAGGRARPDLGPYFYEPTLLAGVTEEMAVCRDETFGPVAAVYRCASADEMVERANESVFGLNASVWTRDAAAGRALARRLRVGGVNINEGYAATWSSASPMGGVGDSGSGRRHGFPGILQYTFTQTVAVQRFLPVSTPPHLRHDQYAGVMLLGLKALRRVPWFDRTGRRS